MPGTCSTLSPAPPCLAGTAACRPRHIARRLPRQASWLHTTRPLGTPALLRHLWGLRGPLREVSAWPAWVGAAELHCLRQELAGWEKGGGGVGTGLCGPGRLVMAEACPESPGIPERCCWALERMRLHTPQDPMFWSWRGQAIMGEAAGSSGSEVGVGVHRLCWASHPCHTETRTPSLMAGTLQRSVGRAGWCRLCQVPLVLPVTQHMEHMAAPFGRP